MRRTKSGGVVHGRTGISLRSMASSKKFEKCSWGLGLDGVLHSHKALPHPVYSLSNSLHQRMNLDGSSNILLLLSPSACFLPLPLCCAALESLHPQQEAKQKSGTEGSGQESCAKAEKSSSGDDMVFRVPNKDWLEVE